MMTLFQPARPDISVSYIPDDYVLLPHAAQRWADSVYTWATQTTTMVNEMAQHLADMQQFSAWVKAHHPELLAAYQAHTAVAAKFEGQSK